MPLNFLDKVYALRFLYLLTRDWEETDAFKLGIIDKEGNQVKLMKDFGEAEKSAYNRFTMLVFNIKKLLSKLPIARLSISKYATALNLIREEFGDVEETFIKYLQESQGIDITKLFVQNILLEENAKYITVLGYLFEAIGTDLSLVGEIPVIDGQADHKAENAFGGDIVFNVHPEHYHKSRLGKDRYARYKTYVGEDELGQKIREYGLKYPKKNIIVRNNADGSMLYFKRKNKENNGI